MSIQPPSSGDRRRPGTVLPAAILAASGRAAIIRSRQAERTARAGYTLLELLVVTAIVVGMIGILMPAVQSARESARSSTCRGNLRQLAQALEHHESSLGFFPSGGWGAGWLPAADRGSDSAQPGGWTFAVLPFAERLDIAQIVANSTVATATADYQALAATADNLFACSSRRTAKARPMAATGYRTSLDPSGNLSITLGATTDYAANGGSSATCPPISVLEQALQYVPSTTKVTFCHSPSGKGGNQQTQSLAISATEKGHADHANDHVGPCLSCSSGMDTVAVNPTSLSQGDQWRAIVPMGRLVLPDGGIPDMQDGLLHRMSQIKASSIKDGEANTYLIGEKYVDAAAYETGADAGDNRVHFAGYSSANVRWAYDPPARDARGVSQPNAFGSSHRAGWNMAFADGSVKTLSFDLDPDIHTALAGRADGKVARPD